MPSDTSLSGRRQAGWFRLLAAVCCCATAGAVCRTAGRGRLPAVFSSNMVLQRGLKVPVWGWADPAQQVTVRVGDRTASSVSGPDGRWTVHVGPLEAGGPLTVTVTAGNTVTVDNVLVGDVWVCSGQSNMDMSVSGALNAAEEIRTARYPQIRLFHVAPDASPTPLDDLEGRWAECSPETVRSFSAAGYFFGRELHQELGVPIGLIHTAVGDSSIRAWMSAQALESDPGLANHVAAMRRVQGEFPSIKQRSTSRVPGEFRANGAFLYNAMMAPLVGYGIKGFIWYQGEKDGGLYREYPRSFKAFLADLRRSWGPGDFPFLFVQLATYKGWGDVQAAPDPEPNEGTWGFIREAQTKCLAESNTAMAVALDRVDFESAHPKDKQAVGHRLALAALANVYGRDIVWCGPTYESMEIEANKIRLRFGHAGGGLVVDGAKGKNGFAVAGADRNFVWADVAVDGDTLLVWSDQVPHPVAVRYAWANFPYFGLHNRDGLPAPTFRTDDW